MTGNGSGAPHPSDRAILTVMFERGTWRWRIAVVGIPGALIATILLSQFVVRDRLPDRLATGWDAAGVPIGSVSGGTLIAMLAFFSMFIWAGTLFFGSRKVPGPEILGIGYAIVTTFAAGQIVVISANLDAGGWETARSIGNAHLVVYVLAVIAALIGAALAGGLRGFGRAEGQ